MKTKLRGMAVLFSFLLVFSFIPPATFADRPHDKKTVSGLQAAKEKSLPAIANTDQDKLFDNLEARLQRITEDEKLPVIVRFKDSVPGQVVTLLQKKIGQFQLTHDYTIIPAISGEMTKWQIEILAKLPFVQSVEYDAEVHAVMKTANESFGTEKARKDFGVDGSHDGLPDQYTKEDIVVAVIDTGIDDEHVDLDEGKVIGWKDFVNGKTEPYDDHGHGTHVAGIVAGEGEGNSSYKGVAPGAALVGIKVLDRRGSGSMSDVTAGIDWAVQHMDEFGIEVLSLSLGTANCSDGTDSTSLAVNEAVEAGLVVTVAAGNSGPAECTIGSPGAAEQAVTVGAAADIGEGGFYLAPFSSRGTTADGRIKPDIVAAGVNITAPEANTGSGYVTYSGTSMATPFTAGTVALMLDAEPSLSPAEVKSHLYNTAFDWGPEGKDIDYGYGMLAGYAAIESAGGFNGENPARPTHIFVSDSLPGSGAYDQFQLQVNDTSVPLAVTMIMPDWTSSWFFSDPDFDVYVYGPDGTIVASSEGIERQETISFVPQKEGTYTIEVYSYSGSGSYFFDVSAGAESFTQ